VASDRNVCAGPFGAVYDFYIEREPVSRIVGRVLWGIDIRPMYRSMNVIGEQADGATILDVPCGGGIALRGLRPDQQARYIAVDLSEKMLNRVRHRAATRGLDPIETVRADMAALPLSDATVDLCLCYSGLHIVEDPQAVLAEIARCLKPGGELVGAMFLLEGSRRQRFLMRRGQQRGEFGVSGTSEDLRTWLKAAAFTDISIDRNDGFAVFSATLDGNLSA
jgi:ubiquinone/menaquinone biosynthesis C-methylase UbiE